MTTCKIEGLPLPEGWEVVGFRKAETGEYYLGGEETPSQWYYDGSSNGTYVIVRRKEKTLAERFDEWLTTNDIKLGSRVKVTQVVTAAGFPNRGLSTCYDPQRAIHTGKVFAVTRLLPNLCCVELSHSYLNFPFEVCEPVKKVLKPWDMDTMPERVKVKSCHGMGSAYWARPATSGWALVGRTECSYKDLLENYRQADGSPCGIEVEE